MPIGCLPLLLFVWFLFLLPFIFADLLMTAMFKLGLSPFFALWAVVWIFIGGLVNIPVKKIPRDNEMDYRPIQMFGLNRFIDRHHFLPYTIIAVNLGGCVIPCLIVAYEFSRLAAAGPHVLIAAVIAVAINVILCYNVARPIPQVGISMPPLVPALAAALCALVFSPELAPPVAFCAGVLGPLIGADMMHLKDIEHINTPIASIGGAGTFDGIVISGLFATLLA